DRRVREALNHHRRRRQRENGERDAAVSVENGDAIEQVDVAVRGVRLRRGRGGVRVRRMRRRGRRMYPRSRRLAGARGARWSAIGHAGYRTGLTGWPVTVDARTPAAEAAAATARSAGALLVRRPATGMRIGSLTIVDTSSPALTFRI